MNKQLSRLISDYQAGVRAALVLMQRSGIQMPISSADWIEADIPRSGKLEGGIHYVKHGRGCTVSLNTGEVDFDFGEQGEIGGFDLWRLTRFAENRPSEYGFETEQALKACFEEAVAAASLVYTADAQYHLADLQHSLAIDIENRLPGDKLPSRNKDRVLVLYAHYFLTTELMRKNYLKIDYRRMVNGRLSQNEAIDMRIYLATWLGFLGVTCEGYRDLRMRILLQNDRPTEFQELIPRCDTTGRLMKRHADPLRELRNKVFHLREDARAIRQFFERDANRFGWAAEVHDAIAGFFLEYRICCEVHYAMNDRRSELISLQKMRKSRKMDAP